MKFCFSFYQILYLILFININLKELKSAHISIDQSIKDHSIVICEEECVKLEHCSSDRWLVCSWNETGVKPESVCCLYGENKNTKLSNKMITLQLFCKYEFQRSSRFSSESISLRKRITFGRNANDGLFPWMASIFMFGQFLCGATIISDHFVVTAAHCFVPLFDVSVYTLRVGSTRLGRGQQYSIANIIVHELFFASESYHDIALVETKTAFNFNKRISFICLPNKDMTGDNLSGLMATVIGFGDTAYKGFLSQELQQIQIPIISNVECAQSYTKGDRHKIPIGIQECMICASSQNGGQDACQGDSGGPMTITINGKHLLVGIVLFGSGCGSDFPGVYTNIAYYRNWILHVLYRYEN